MLLSICDNSTVLSIFRIVKILIRIITIVVPLILIISSMTMLIKEMHGGDNDLLGKSLKSIATKSIAAILIFLIPTFVNILADISGNDSSYKTCVNNATITGISETRYKEAKSLVETAKKDINKANYQVALSKVNKIKEDGLKKELLDELSVVKDSLDLKEEINQKLSTGTEEEYEKLLARVNKLEDSDFKKSLLATLAKMKERIDEENLGNAVKVLANITSYPPKQKSKNVTVNFYSTGGNRGFTFWLYLPDKMKSGLPIVFYMHDLGGRGNDYFDGTTAAIWGGPMREVMSKDKDWQAIIVHAQVPYGEYSQGYRYLYHELLEKLAEGFKADKQKISVMGFSNGCYGVWAIVREYQNFFSAAVPIGCSAGNVNPNIFKTTPMWTLVGSGDGHSTMPGFAQRVNQLNGNSKHSNSKYYQHNCVYPAEHEGVLLEYDVVEWMISQKRSN